MASTTARRQRAAVVSPAQLRLPPARLGRHRLLSEPRWSAACPAATARYVRIEVRSATRRWIEGLKAGRSFVTNGPFVELTVDGRHPGDDVRLAGPGKVKVRAKAWWQLPLRRAELVQDGKVIAAKEFAADSPQELAWEQEVPFERSGWLALRHRAARHTPTTPAAKPTPTPAPFTWTWPAALPRRGRIPSSSSNGSIAWR